MVAVRAGGRVVGPDMFPPSACVPYMVASLRLSANPTHRAFALFGGSTEHVGGLGLGAILAV
jgi:hypothetical protein